MNHDDPEFSSKSSSSSTLSSLFDSDKPRTSENNGLIYVAQKDPKAGDSSRSSQLTTSGSTISEKSVVIIAKSAQVYKFEDGNYINQGTAGVAVVGNYDLNKYQIILYKDKRNYLSRTDISPKFEFVVSENNYASFYDNTTQNWSLLFSSSSDIEQISKQVAICKYNSQDQPGNVLLQETIKSAEAKVKESDVVTVKYNCYMLINEKVIPIEKNKSESIKLTDTSFPWHEGLKNSAVKCKRVIILPYKLSAPWTSHLEQNSSLLVEFEIESVESLSSDFNNESRRESASQKSASRKGSSRKESQDSRNYGRGSKHIEEDNLEKVSVSQDLKNNEDFSEKKLEESENDLEKRSRKSEGVSDRGLRSSEIEGFKEVLRKTEQGGSQRVSRKSEIEGSIEVLQKIEEDGSDRVSRRSEIEGSKEVLRKTEQGSSQGVSRKNEIEGSIEVLQKIEEDGSDRVSRRSEIEGSKEVLRKTEQGGSQRVSRKSEIEGSIEVLQKIEEDGSDRVSRRSEIEGSKEVLRKSEQGSSQRGLRKSEIESSEKWSRKNEIEGSRDVLMESNQDDSGRGLRESEIGSLEKWSRKNEIDSTEEVLKKNEEDYSKKRLQRNERDRQSDSRVDEDKCKEKPMSLKDSIFLSRSHRQDLISRIVKIGQSLPLKGGLIAGVNDSEQEKCHLYKPNKLRAINNAVQQLHQGIKISVHPCSSQYFDPDQNSKSQSQKHEKNISSQQQCCKTDTNYGTEREVHPIISFPPASENAQENETNVTNTELTKRINKVSEKVDCVLNKLKTLDACGLEKTRDYNSAAVLDPISVINSIQNFAAENEVLKSGLQQQKCKIDDLNYKIQSLMDFTQRCVDRYNFYDSKETRVREKPEDVEVRLRNTMNQFVSNLERYKMEMDEYQRRIREGVTLVEDQANRELTQITSEENFEEIKRVMNALNKKLQTYFESNKTYLGSDIKEVIAATVKEVTLDYIQYKSKQRNSFKDVSLREDTKVHGDLRSRNSSNVKAESHKFSYMEPRASNTKNVMERNDELRLNEEMKRSFVEQRVSIGPVKDSEKIQVSSTGVSDSTQRRSFDDGKYNMVSKKSIVEDISSRRLTSPVNNERSKTASNVNEQILDNQDSVAENIKVEKSILSSKRAVSDVIKGISSQSATRKSTLARDQISGLDGSFRAKTSVDGSRIASLSEEDGMENMKVEKRGSDVAEGNVIQQYSRSSSQAVKERIGGTDKSTNEMETVIEDDEVGNFEPASPTNEVSRKSVSRREHSNQQEREGSSIKRGEEEAENDVEINDGDKEIEDKDGVEIEDVGKEIEEKDEVEMKEDKEIEEKDEVETKEDKEIVEKDGIEIKDEEKDEVEMKEDKEIVEKDGIEIKDEEKDEVEMKEDKEIVEKDGIEIKDEEKDGLEIDDVEKENGEDADDKIMEKDDSVENETVENIENIEKVERNENDDENETKESNVNDTEESPPLSSTNSQGNIKDSGSNSIDLSSIYSDYYRNWEPSIPPPLPLDGEDDSSDGDEEWL